jgi:hypothetical protein
MSDFVRVAIPDLTNTNWSVWRLKMEAILTKKGLHEVVFPTFPKGASNDKKKDILAARDATKMASARAELIVHVCDDQLAHMQSEDPREIWLTLEGVHVTHGFATSLSLRWQFLTGRKLDGEPMNAWIGRVQTLAFKLEDAGITVSDQDKILALTLGLPAAYEPIIINFDATPAGDLKWSNVVARLLNEEVRQTTAATVSPLDNDSETAQALAARTAHCSRPLLEITCHLCDEKGHFKINCPLCAPLAKLMACLSGTESATLAFTDNSDDVVVAF